MIKFIIYIYLLLANVNSQKKISIKRPEGERNFLIHVPQNNTQQYSLHLTFHGLGDNCNNFIKATNFIPLSDKHNIILVAPCGFPGYFGNNSWNAGSCCQPDKSVNDIEFTKEIITYMKTNYNINTNNSSFRSQNSSRNESSNEGKRINRTDSSSHHSREKQTRNENQQRNRSDSRNKQHQRSRQEEVSRSNKRSMNSKRDALKRDPDL